MPRASCGLREVLPSRDAPTAERRRKPLVRRRGLSSGARTPVGCPEAFGSATSRNVPVLAVVDVGSRALRMAVAECCPGAPPDDSKA